MECNATEGNKIKIKITFNFPREAPGPVSQFGFTLALYKHTIWDITILSASHTSCTLYRH